MSTTTLMTAEQLMRMPRGVRRYELVSGVLKTAPLSGFVHGEVLLSLGTLLSSFVRQHGLGLVSGGEPGFLLARDPDTVRAPDVAFVGTERLAANPVTDFYWPGPPDLAVEVMSFDDTVYGMDEKAKVWLDAGVRMVWVVNPARRTVTVYRSATDIKRLTEDDDLDGHDVLPGFRCRVADIFPTE